MKTVDLCQIPSPVQFPKLQWISEEVCVLVDGLTMHLKPVKDNSCEINYCKDRKLNGGLHQQKIFLFFWWKEVLPDSPIATTLQMADFHEALKI